MNKRQTRKLTLNRETLHRMEEVQMALAAGGSVELVSGETDPTVCRTAEYSSCCPPTSN
jgi:hypothetical protein